MTDPWVAQQLRGELIAVAMYVLDDEPGSGEVLAPLRRERIDVQKVPPAQLAAARRLEERQGPLVILVWSPPGLEEERLRRLHRGRDPARVGLIGWCVRGSGEDVERALACGFDDFVAGRASVRELAGRIRALHRRLLSRPPRRAPERLRCGGITIDLARYQLWVKGRRVRVTVTELWLLAALVEARGRPLSREELLDAAWDAGTPDARARAVDSVIMRLRRKLGDPRLIATVRGVGFRLVEP